MHIREKMRPGGFTQTTESLPPDVVQYYQSDVHGYGQAISSLNDGVRPAGYSCNGVTIFKWHTSSQPCKFGPAKAWGTYSIVAEGDIAGYLARQHYVPEYPLVPDWDAGLAQEAKNKAMAKVGEADLELGVMIGELRETLEGLRNPASALRKYLKDGKFYRDIGTRKAQLEWYRKQSRGNRVDAATGSWMEGRYGWAPLIYSIDDIMQHVESKRNSLLGKIRTKRSKTAKLFDSEETENYSMPGSYAYKYTVHRTWTVQYFASVAYRLTRPPNMAEAYGMSFLDAPGIGYELITRSFVLDWFVSIGTWLAALKTEITDRISILGVSVSRRVDTSQTTMVKEGLLYGVVPIGSDGISTHEISYEVLERRCSPEEFHAVMPALNSNALSLLQTIDATALLLQGIQSLLKRRK